MKFSLRFIIVFTILTGTGLGLYFLELEKRKPVPLNVDYHVEMENEVDRPATLIEYRSRLNVDEVGIAAEWYDERRIREVERDFSRFSSDSWYAQGFLDRHPKRMRKAAEKGIDHDKFEAVVSAAWTLGKFGDPIGFEKLQQRILENRESDQAQYWRAFETMAEENVPLSDELVAKVREIAFSDSSSAEEAAFLLFRAGVDEQPLLENLKECKVEDDELMWLLRNRPTTELVPAIKMRISANPMVSYSNTDLYATILELGQSNPEFKSLVESVETNLVRFLNDDDLEDFDRDWSLTQLKRCATKLSIPFLESQINDFDVYTFYPEMITLLHDLGEEESAKGQLLRLVDKLSGDFKKWNGEDVKNGLMRIAPSIVGPEKSLELCIKHGSPIGLSEFIESTRADDAHEKMGCARKTLDRARKKAIEYLTGKESSSDFTFSRFASNWFESNLSRQKAVDWINENLKPSDPLTVQRVLNHERYPVGEGIWFTWSRFDHHVDDIHTFLLMALAHSGHGHLAHWEYTHPGAVTDSIEELATTESNEFRVGAHDEEGSYPATFSIVVNDRVYKFDVDEGPNGSDERYDVGVIADLVNTIAIRQRLKRRLFIYDCEKGYCLVMFITPDMARELYSVFSIYPDRGSDHYLDH